MTRAEYFNVYDDCCATPEWQATLQQIWLAMDACNLSGVVHSWAQWVSALWDEAHRLGRGTEWVNQHPVNVIVADKLRQLSRTAYETERESWAYDWVGQRAVSR